MDRILFPRNEDFLVLLEQRDDDVEQPKLEDLLREDRALSEPVGDDEPAAQFREAHFLPGGVDQIENLGRLQDRDRLAELLADLVGDVVDVRL